MPRKMIPCQNMCGKVPYITGNTSERIQSSSEERQLHQLCYCSMSYLPIPHAFIFCLGTHTHKDTSLKQSLVLGFCIWNPKAKLLVNSSSQRSINNEPKSLCVLCCPAAIWLLSGIPLGLPPTTPVFCSLAAYLICAKRSPKR